MTRALITGIDGEDGAYLARLLDARGTALWGVARAADGLARLDDLAVRARVRLAGVADGLAAAPDEIYDLAGDAALTRHLLGALTDGTRLFHATSATTTDEATPAAVRAARMSGRFVVSGVLFDHASRLSDTAHPVLVRVTAARDAARAATPLLVDAPDNARDLGWSPEYVDAMTQVLRADAAADHVIATGIALSDHDIARHALDFFGGDPALLIAGTATAPPPQLGDPAPLRALGWRAYTHGRDLVRALCEGLA